MNVLFVFRIANFNHVALIGVQNSKNGELLYTLHSAASRQIFILSPYNEKYASRFNTKSLGGFCKVLPINNSTVMVSRRL